MMRQRTVAIPVGSLTLYLFALRPSPEEEVDGRAAAQTFASGKGATRQLLWRIDCWRCLTYRDQ